MRTVYIIRGVPGAGKSTLANLIAWPWQIIEADQYFHKLGRFVPAKLDYAHTLCKKKFIKRIKNTLFNRIFFRKIVVSNTSTTESEFMYYFDLAKNYNLRVICLVVENRNDTVSTKNIPVDTINKMRNRFQIKL